MTDRRFSIRRLLKRAALIVMILFGVAHLYVLVLGFFPSPRTWTMTGRIMAGETLQRQNINIEDVSPFLISAVIAAEDARFCSHHGIDRAAIEQAIEDNKKGGRRRGGSTITQQTAKNLFFWNGGGMARKAGEAYAALLIDAVWPKTIILQHYLNIAEWGDGIFGIEAAAQTRFGKSAKDLTAYEAALLASVLPSPNKWRLDPPTAFVKDRARTINARLKVAARQSLGECVLLNHPDYNRAKFSVPLDRPQAKTQNNNKIADTDKSSESKAPPQPSLVDVLSAAETAAQSAQERKQAVPQPPASEENVAQNIGTEPTPVPAQDQPIDIRPPALKPQDQETKDE